MRETHRRNASEVAKIAAFSKENGVDLRTVELDVLLKTFATMVLADSKIEPPHIDRRPMRRGARTGDQRVGF